MPAVEDIEIPRGDSTTLVFTIADEEDSSIAGATARWRAWPALYGVPTTDIPSIAKEESDGITITDPDERIVEVDLAAEDTEGLPQGEYYHELEIVIAGKVSTVTVGKMLLTPTYIDNESS